ncbi:MAG: DMT family transporter [Jiangellales bacterium]
MSAPGTPSAPLMRAPTGADMPLLALAVVGIGASAPLIATIAAPALAIALWRNVFGTVALLPFAGVGARHDLARVWTDRRLRRVVVASGMALAVHFATWVPAVTLTTVAAATALGAVQPVWNALLARAGGQQVARRAWVGIVVAVLGALLLTGLDLGGDPRAMLGNLLAVVGGMAAAVYVALGARARAQVSTLAYSVSTFGVCAVLLLVLCMAAGVPVIGFSAQAWGLLLALTVLAQLLGHTLLNRAVGTVGPVVVALVILLEVPAATVIAAWWLGQVPPLAALPAAGLVLVGVALVVTSRQPVHRPPLPDA